MKTFRALLLFLPILLISCEKHLLQENAVPSYKLSIDSKVSLDDISSYLSEVKDLPSLKAGDDVVIQPITNGPDTLMYLINYDKGWELLSADKRAPVVLAMSPDGNMTIEGLSSNPAEEDMYTSLTDGLIALKSDSKAQITTATNTWNDFLYKAEVAEASELESWVLIGTDVVETSILNQQNHLVATKWGQGTMYTTSPTWNISAPYTDSSKTYHCYTGCVPTAAAQILHYMNSKTSNPYNSYTSCSVSTFIKSGDTSATITPYEISLNGANPYVWDAMPLESSSSVTSTQYKYVSALMVYLGYLYKAKYKLTGTSASTYNTPDIFASNFNLSCSYVSYNKAIVSNQIIQKTLPVLLNISYYVDGVRKGHAVIADGYMSRVSTIEKTYVWNSLTQGPQYKTETLYESESFVAINWGWDGTGMYSGTEPIWYNADVINWTVGSHTFTSVDGMVYGFAKIS